MNKPKVIELFQRMSELTHPECCKCKRPYSCCSPEYCGMAIEYAAEEWGVTLEPTGNRLPLLGDKGCIALPHLRPLCTLHTCDINSIGTSGNVEWDEKYFKLRDEINDASYESEEIHD